MEYIHDIALNLTPDGNIPVVRVKLGDISTRFIHATIYKDGEQWAVGSELTVLFRMEKPDGTHVLMDSEHSDTILDRYLVVINQDGSVTVELTNQTTSCAGMSICDLCFLYGEQAISTATFIIAVEQIPDISGAAVSSDDFRTLINALEDVGLSSPVYLSSMSDVRLNNLLDEQILIYDGVSQKWINVEHDSLGYQTANDVISTINQYGFQTESQVQALIADYIDSLDANNTEY